MPAAEAPRTLSGKVRSLVAPALGVAFLSFVAIGLFDGALGTAWPAIHLALGLPIGDLALLQLAGTSGFLLSSTFSGRLSARFGRARSLAMGATVGTCALALLAGSPGLAMVLIAIGFAGIGTGFVEPGVQSHVALVSHGRMMNFLHGCYGVGATLGPFLVSGLLLVHASWRFAYVILIALQALVLVGILRRRSALDATTPERPRKVPVGAPRDRLPVLSLTTALLAFFVYVGVEIGTGLWAFTLLTAKRHFGIGLAGLIAGGYWACITAVRFGTALRGPRMDPAKLLVLSATGAVVGELLWWWNPSAGTGVAGLLLVGASLAPAFPVMMSRTSSWASSTRVSVVIGWQSASASVGVAALSGLAGLLVQNLGLGALYPYLAFLAICYLALQVLALAVLRR